MKNDAPRPHSEASASAAIDSNSPIAILLEREAREMASRSGQNRETPLSPFS
jgi:hypothetical protein